MSTFQIVAFIKVIDRNPDTCLHCMHTGQPGPDRVVPVPGTVVREVKLIRLPSDSMADRGHKTDHIYLLCYLHGHLVTPLCCNDANVNHCSKNNLFTQCLHSTCRNDFWQSVAEIVVIYMWALPSWISQQASSCLVVYVIMLIPTAILLSVSESWIIRAEKESNIIVIH